MHTPVYHGGLNELAHLEKFSLMFLSSSFLIRVNLLHPLQFLFLYGLILSASRSAVLANFYFQVSFNLKLIFCVAKITQNKGTRITPKYFNEE